MAPTTAMAIAPLLIQVCIQYPQATKKAVKSPNPSREYAYGPPLLLTMILLKLLNILARINDPAAVTTQPKRLMLPYFAKVDGNKKIPTPIILPITNDVAVISPIF